MCLPARVDSRVGSLYGGKNRRGLTDVAGFERVQVKDFQFLQLRRFIPDRQVIATAIGDPEKRLEMRRLYRKSV